MEKLKMHTNNIANINYYKLKEMFPNAVTETIDSNGKIIRAIDKDILQQEISCEIIDDKEERYQFSWPDKKNSILLSNSPINKTLRPSIQDSVDFDNTQNIYIEGDNLDVLKLLRETYLGKVKMIYIDPPYNTGNDFVYNDDFVESADEYIERSGQYDQERHKLFQNSESNGRFHTDWLNMIYPRLRVAKDLLSDDGVIFISIGEDEVSNLIKVCDEIFGVENRIPIFNRVTKKSSNNGNNFSPCIDYVIIYAKNINSVVEYKIPMSDEIISRYNKEDEYVNSRGRYQEVGLFQSALKHGGSNYPIECPDGECVYPPNGQPWRWNEKTFLQGKAEGRIVFKKSGTTPLLETKTNKRGHWNIYTKVYLNERSETGMHPKNFSEFYQNTLASNELRNLGIPFDFAKPSELIKFFIKLQCNKEDIIMDFFSGSASTAHATMELNAEDNGERKYILVQLPEICDEKSEAFKTGYNNICEIGEERIRRVGKKINDEHPNNSVDTGFRVLKLDSSNMKDVYYNPQDYNKSLFDVLDDNIKEDRTSEDLLFQVMLELGVPLSSRIVEQIIDGKKIYNVAENHLLACFDGELTNDIITTVAKKQPLYFVMRDSSVKDDSVAINLEQIFKTYSPNTIRRVL